jgi:hypothetical protein
MGRTAGLDSCQRASPHLRKSVGAADAVVQPDDVLLNGDDHCDTVFPRLPLQSVGMDRSGMELSQIGGGAKSVKTAPVEGRCASWAAFQARGMCAANSMNRLNQDHTQDHHRNHDDGAAVIR